MSQADSGSRAKATLYMGAGCRCLNPAMPISLAGYFNIRLWDHVRDDIEVRALALRSGNTWAAVVQFDLVTLTQPLADAVYAGLAGAGIRELTPDSMILTATHTHTAPEIRTGKPGGDDRYLPFAAGQAVAAIRDALAAMEPVEPLSGLTRDTRFLFNRRYWMNNGEVVTNPGKLNPDIDRPEGEIDPDIPLLAFRQGGRIKALVANIVNHGDTVGGTGVSADWHGFLRRRLEARLGAGSFVMPLVGASGNINHFDVRSAAPQTCYAEARRLGEGYAETIGKALGSLQPLADTTLFTRAVRVTASPRAISAAELAEARSVLERFKDVPDAASGGTLTSEDLARGAPAALKYFAAHLADMAAFRDPIQFLLTSLFLGPVGIVTLPGEPFVEIGLDLRRRIFPDRLMMVAELGNGTGHPRLGGGYIPNEWNYGRGGYETTPRSNPFAPETAGQLLAAWRGVADRIRNASA